MSEICMNAHKIKVALESRKDKTMVWYKNDHDLRVITTSYNEKTNEYMVAVSGITFWFTNFVYQHKNNRIIGYYGDEIIVFINGDLI